MDSVGDGRRLGRHWRRSRRSPWCCCSPDWSSESCSPVASCRSHTAPRRRSTTTSRAITRRPSTGLALSSLTTWTLSRPEVTSDAALVRALYYLTYLTGGPWHVVTLGLLIAGIAVPGLIVRLMPLPVAWTGLVIAGIAELTTLVLIWPGLSPLLPLARFTGLIWLIVAGALLPLRRLNKQEATARS